MVNMIHIYIERHLGDVFLKRDLQLARLTNAHWTIETLGIETIPDMFV